MAAKNLMFRVTTTVTVRNAKLRTSADRIGSGFAADAVSQPPAEFLSPGQFLPHQRLASEPEPGSRQQEVSAMRYPLNAVIPAGLVGRFSGPVGRRGLPAADTSRQTHAWSQCPSKRFGRDCQSPDRRPDATDRKRESGLTATLATRMRRPAATAAK
jgi:hypothetical protein